MEREKKLYQVVEQVTYTYAIEAKNGRMARDLAYAGELDVKRDEISRHVNVLEVKPLSRTFEKNEKDELCFRREHMGGLILGKRLNGGWVIEVSYLGFWEKAPGIFGKIRDGEEWALGRLRQMRHK